ncbi:hypothetical protein ACFL3P_01650 [Pseudomonadota bacterium]
MGSNTRNSEIFPGSSLTQKATLSLAVAAALSIAPVSLAAPGDVIFPVIKIPASTAVSEVAMDADGDFVVAWRNTGNVYSKYGEGYFSLYDKSGNAVVKQARFSFTGQTACHDVAMDDDGDFVVTWTDYYYGYTATGSTYFQLFKSSGAPAGPQTLMQGSVFGCPKVSMDADGDFVVALSPYTGFPGVLAQTFDRFGKTITQIGQIQPTDAQINSNFPFGNHDVAMDADGDFVVTYATPNSGYSGYPYYNYIPPGLNYARYSLDGRASDSGPLAGKSYAVPKVAIDDDGDFVVVARRNSGDAEGFSVGSKGGLNFSYLSVSAMGTTPDNIPAAVSMDADGDFNVTGFTNNNAAYMEISRFDLDGRYIGASISSERFAGYRAPTIAMDADGDFVAAAFNGDTREVVVQRFEGPDPVVDLGLYVLPSATTIEPGGSLTYNVLIDNHSSDFASDAAENVEVTFNQTAGNSVTFASFTGLGWSCSSVASYYICDYVLELPVANTASALGVTVNAPNTNGLVTMNIAASSSSVDENNGDNSDLINTDVAGGAVDLTLGFSDGVAEIYTAEKLTYAASVINNAGATASNVKVSMPIETGLAYDSFTGVNWTCEDTSVTNTVTCLYGSTLDPTVAASPLNIIMDTVTAGVVNSTATLSSDQIDSNTLDNTVTDITNVIDYAVNLAVTIDDGLAQADNGSELVYVATVSNNASNDISATGVIMDVALDSSLTFVSAGGAYWNCTGTGPVNCTYTPVLAQGATAPPVTIKATAPVALGVVTTKASANANEAEEDPADNIDISDITNIVKGTVDLAINSNSPTSVKDGGAVAFVLSAVNNSTTTTATGISIETILDTNLTYNAGASGGANWSCGVASNTVTCNYSLALAATATTPSVVIAVDETGVATDGAILTTTSTVSSSDQFDSDATDNAIDDDMVVVGEFVDLSLTFGDGVMQLNTGDNFAYAVTVTNAHAAADPATNVSIVVDLSPDVVFVSDNSTDWNCQMLTELTCNYVGTGISGNNGLSTFDINVIAPSSAGLLNSSAILTTTQNDLSVVDNAAEDNDTNVIVNKVDLSVILSDGISVARPGDGMMYVASVTNNAINAINATAIELDIDLDANLVFKSASSFDFVCPAADLNNIVSCTYAGNLAQGETISAYIFVDAPSTAVVLNTTATATETNIGDLNAANDTATDTTSVINDVVDLSLDVTGDSTVVVVGKLAKYQATVTNDVVLGDEATDVTVEFNLSDQLTFDANKTAAENESNNWTCTELIGVITCSYSQPLAPSETTPAVKIEADVSMVAGEIVTSALASASLPDSDESNNSVTITNEIVDTQLDLEIDLVDGADFVAVNQSMTYVATVTNKVGSLFDSSFTIVTFDLDPGLTYVGSPSTGWDCFINDSSILQCNYNSVISAGASQSVTIEVVSPSIEGKISSSASVRAANRTELSIDNNESDEGTVITVASSSAGALSGLYGVLMMLVIAGARQRQYKICIRK